MLLGDCKSIRSFFSFKYAHKDQVALLLKLYVIYEKKQADSDVLGYIINKYGYILHYICGNDY